MSFLWGPAPNAEFDALLDKTTSDLLPSSSPPDLPASLQLADLIRSSSVTSVQASKSLLRRLQHTNPNVQLLTLQVLDICIKNGGSSFLLQIGNAEFANELEKLSRGYPGGNREVKEAVMAKVQDWATAFKQMDKLKRTDLVTSYDKMKEEGLPFPPRDLTATAAMVDSLSAPEWTDGPCCSRCRTDFSTFNRKHHCRNCGRVFDQACSSQTAALPHFGVTALVRVCDGCVKLVKEGKGSTGLDRSASSGGNGKSGSGRPNLPERSSTIGTSGSSSKGEARKSRREREDDDLAKAIAASLVESGSPSSTAGPAFQLRDPPPISNTNGNGYNPSYSQPSRQEAEEEDDPDLKAAIAASLRDVAQAPSAPARSYSYGPTSPNATYSSLYPSSTPAAAYSYPTPAATATLPPTSKYALPSYDLTPSESSTINEFNNAQFSPQQGVGYRERELYEGAQKVYPRLERGLLDTERRKDMLVDMNAKLGEVTRLYQGLLEKRVNGAASYQDQNQYQHQPQPTYQQPYYSAASPQPYAPPTPYSPTMAQATHPPQAYFAPPQPPINLGQPLPHSLVPPQAPLPMQQYAPQSPPQQYQSPPPATAVQHQQQLPHQYHAPPQQQPPQQQPAGYYKPSSFPVVPNNPLPSQFPQVPTDNPWERERVEKEEEQKVGELIEL